MIFFCFSWFTFKWAVEIQVYRTPYPRLVQGRVKRSDSICDKIILIYPNKKSTHFNTSSSLQLDIMYHLSIYFVYAPYSRKKRNTSGLRNIHSYMYIFFNISTGWNGNYRHQFKCCMGWTCLLDIKRIFRILTSAPFKWICNVRYNVTIFFNKGPLFTHKHILYPYSVEDTNSTVAQLFIQQLVYAHNWGSIKAGHNWSNCVIGMYLSLLVPWQRLVMQKVFPCDVDM